MSGVGIPVDGTVASHVPSAATDTTDNVRCEVTLFGTVILAVTDTAAVLTNLVLIVTESTVEGGQLSELVTLVVVLTFRRGSRLR